MTASVKRNIAILIVGIVGIVAVAVLRRSLEPRMTHPPEARTASEVEVLKMVVDEFRLLKGKPAATIAEVVGASVAGSSIYETNTNRINARGEYVDLWGNPYMLAYDSVSNTIVVSAGRDGKFGNRDDIQSN